MPLIDSVYTRRIGFFHGGHLVTRNDVAKLAGTSTAVVSYVINNGPRNVSPEARARVLAAIEQLQYKPNTVARALRSSASRVLGLVVPDILNPYFAELALAIENLASAHGYIVLLGNAKRDDNQQAHYLGVFMQHQVDGLILIGVRADSTDTPATDAALRSVTTPVVFLDRPPPQLPALAVIGDNEQGGYLATQHLLGHGHEKVAELAGPRDLRPTKDRSAGWARALTLAGKPPTEQVSISTPFNRSDAFGAAYGLLAGDATRPTAVFSHSDEQAIGLVRAADHLGIRVPEELAIVSFDCVRESALVKPPLTTVAQPIERLAHETITQLLDRIRSQEQRQQTVVLPVGLVIRQSCGCASGSPQFSTSPVNRTNERGGSHVRKYDE